MAAINTDLMLFGKHFVVSLSTASFIDDDNDSLVTYSWHYIVLYTSFDRFGSVTRCS